MKRLMIFCAATAITLLATACSSDTHDADVKAIQANEAQWNQDYFNKDAAKLASHYANNAILMIPGSPAVSGIEAIRTNMTEMASDPALSLKFLTNRIDVAKSGDLAYTQGTYTITLTDPQTKQIINDHGSYVTTYRKQPDGTWKAVADIASSAIPMAAPAPPPVARAKKSGKKQAKKQTKKGKK
jgi:uncharacterized protein (TIGR02246 family)